MTGLGDVSDCLPAPSSSDTPYRAGANHTVEFARLATQYAQLYDKWNSLTSDALRAQQDSARKQEQAEELKKLMLPIAEKLREHMVKV